MLLKVYILIYIMVVVSSKDLNVSELWKVCGSCFYIFKILKELTSLPWVSDIIKEIY